METFSTAKDNVNDSIVNGPLGARVALSSTPLLGSGQESRALLTKFGYLRV